MDTRGSKAVPHQNIAFHELLKHIPWPELARLVEKHEAEPDVRGLKTRAHLIAMLYGQLFGAQGLREIENGLKSHARKLYHLGGCTASRTTLATANKQRPAAVFTGLLTALMQQLQRGYRRKIADCIRLIDSTSIRLNGLSGDWATFSAEVCGAKAHVVYDPDADQPLYVMVTTARVNDITVAQAMPIERGATYVFDLGYYDYGWWAELHGSECRIVTRLKSNTPFEVVQERLVDPETAVLSDRIGHLPKRLASSRRNPMSAPVREIRVTNQSGKELRIVTNDLISSAEQIADLYKRRWAIELFFRWVKQNLKITHFFGTSENAVRIQITVALIAFMLLRLAHEATQLRISPFAFARLIRANLMHPRSLAGLLHHPPHRENSQAAFDFESAATRAAHRRRQCRRILMSQTAA
jgi:hypothetical protein